ncbi:MAG: hypothetical protein HC834_02570 [Rhodospirillales bacterium]|nr:hypothetical protein [Rhodospirillales bacterium]
MVQKIEGYAGTNPLTTSYAYHESSANSGNYTRLKHTIEPTGKWIRYAYFDDNLRLGRVQATYEPWIDAPASPTAADYANGQVTTFLYVTDWAGISTRPSSIIRTVAGTTVGKTTISYTDTPVTESVVYNGTTYSVTRYLVQASTKNYYSSTDYSAAVARVYREDAGMGLLPNGQYEKTRGFLPGRPYDATTPDGTKQTWTYTRGVRDSWMWGFINLPEGSEWQITQQHVGPSGPVAGLSTSESTIYAYDGTPVLNRKSIYGTSRNRVGSG